MSTFTPVNGPCSFGGGSSMNSAASVAALTELIQKYEAVIQQLTNITNDIGTKANLTTDDRDNLVAAINEVNSIAESKVDSSALTGINSSIAALQSSVTMINSALGTKATTTELSNLDTKVGSLTDLTTTVKTSIVTAINELKSETAVLSDHIGSLSSLTTDDKSTVVAALNEIDSNTDTNTEDIAALKTTVAERNTYLDFDGITRVALPFAGITATDDNDPNGVFIIGMFSETFTKYPDVDGKFPKPSTVYLKYINTYPFDAVITATVTDDNKAAIVATYSRDSDGWQSTQFHVLHGTDSNGKKHYYLGISADPLTTAGTYYKYTTIAASDLPENPSLIPLYEYNPITNQYLRTSDTAPVEARNAYAWTSSDDKSYFTLTDTPSVGSTVYLLESNILIDTGKTVTAYDDTDNYIVISNDEAQYNRSTIYDTTVPAKTYYSRSTEPGIVNTDFYITGIDFFVPGNDKYVTPNGSCTIVSSIKLPDNSDSGNTISLDVATSTDIIAMFDSIFQE